MTKTIGFVLVFIGACVGAYFAIWWAFIGGLMDIIYAVRADELIKADIFIGLAKMFFSTLIGYATAAIFFIPGFVMIQDD